MNSLFSEKALQKRHLMFLLNSTKTFQFYLLPIHYYFHTIYLNHLERLAFLSLLSSLDASIARSVLWVVNTLFLHQSIDGKACLCKFCILVIGPSFHTHFFLTGMIGFYGFLGFVRTMYSSVKLYWGSASSDHF